MKLSLTLTLIYAAATTSVAAGADLICLGDGEDLCITIARNADDEFTDFKPEVSPNYTSAVNDNKANFELQYVETMYSTTIWKIYNSHDRMYWSLDGADVMAQKSNATKWALVPYQTSDVAASSNKKRHNKNQKKRKQNQKHKTLATPQTSNVANSNNKKRQNKKQLNKKRQSKNQKNRKLNKEHKKSEHQLKKNKKRNKKQKKQQHQLQQTKPSPPTCTRMYICPYISNAIESSSCLSSTGSEGSFLVTADKGESIHKSLFLYGDCGPGGFNVYGSKYISLFIFF